MQNHRPPIVTRRNAKETLNQLSGSGVAATGKKFMLTLRESVYNELQKIADRRGVTIQGLIRAVIVPEWHIEHSSDNTESSKPEVLTPEGESVVKDSMSISPWPKTRGTIEETSSRKLVAQASHATS